MIPPGRGYLKWLANNANDPAPSVRQHIEMLRELAWLPAYASAHRHTARSAWLKMRPSHPVLADLATTSAMADIHRLATQLARAKPRAKGRAKRSWIERTLLAWLDAASQPVVVALLLRQVDPVTRRAAAAQSGRTALAHGLDAWWTCLRLRIPPDEFHNYALHRPQRRRVIGDFLLHDEARAIYTALNRRTVGLSRNALADKAAFWMFCERHEIPTAKLLAIASAGRLTLFEPHASSEWRGDVFMKPMHSSTGVGHYRWLHDGKLHYRGPLDELLSQDELLTELSELSTLRAVLLERRLINDSVTAAWTNGALATVRVMTGRSAAGEIKLIAAAVKLPVGRSLVDNFGRGNVLAQIDPATGTIAAGQFHSDRLTDIECHPGTRQRFAGMVMPQWARIAALAIRVHALFPTHVLLSFDIAPTPDGPVVVEVNGRGDTRILQYPGARPLGQTAFPQIVLSHFPTREPAADILSS
jgi:hypothetical protein